MFICKDVLEKHTPAFETIQGKVGETVKQFLVEHTDIFQKLVRDEMLMGSLGEVHSLEIGDSLIHLKMVESNEYNRARAFIANKTTGISSQLLMSSLVEAEKRQNGLPSHLEGHLEEHGARSWYWEADMEVNELTGEKEQLFVDTTAAIVALSILAKENKTWLNCTLTFPETNSSDTLPITPNTIYEAPTFVTEPYTTYVSAGKQYCSRTFTMEDMVNMQLIEFSEADVALNKAEWAKQNPVEEKEVETV